MRPAPLTLGIDTATADTCVAVCRAGEVLAERRIGPGPDGRPRHARSLLGAIEGAVAEAGGWDEVGSIAVGIGPGSFTGIRIGVATARALGQGRGLPLVAVQSTAALAAGIEAPAGSDRVGVIDARRGELFAAVLATGSETASEPELRSPAELGELLSQLRAPVAAGDGAIRSRGELEGAGAMVPPDSAPAHRLSARYVCALASRLQAGPPETVKPLYLRRPDAELWRERDGNR